MGIRQAVRSFDLFDTLVARRCGGPRAIFEMMEVRTGVTGLAQARAEAEARIFDTPYTLADIYEEVCRSQSLPFASAASLGRLELALEWENLMPVVEHCAEVEAGDLIISDMYLPREFIGMVLKEVCGLPFNPVFLSSHGKRNGRVWQMLAPYFAISEHLGNDVVTDFASPQRHGVPARITLVTKFTPRETFLADHGLAPLANLIREARLTTWDGDAVRREAQLAQIQANFPLLFVASLRLAQMAEQRGWEALLFSSRDCYLWSQLYAVLAGVLGRPARSAYFFTSRVARANPSDSYLRYFDSLRACRRSVVVDICGTGWSTRRLIQHSPDPPTDQFLIHHVRDSNVERLYQQFGRITLPTPLYALTVEGDHHVWELLNFAQHPMVVDVIEMAGEFLPVFSEIRHDERRSAVIEAHHSAFLRASTLARGLSSAQVQQMTVALSPQVVAELYCKLPFTGAGLVELAQHQRLEEHQVWQLLHRGRDLASSRI